MAYIPVAQRGIASKNTGYVPVAKRVATPVTPAKPIQVAPKSVDPFVIPNVELPFSGAPKPTTPFAATPIGVATNTLLGIPGVIGDLAQETARNIGSAGVTLAKLAGGADEVEIPKPLQIIFKHDPIRSIETRIAEAEPQVKEWGEAQKGTAFEPLGNFAKQNPLLFAFGGVMGSVGLDLTPFGGLEDNAIKALKGVKTEEQALQVLSKMKVSPEIAQRIAPEVVKAATDEEAKNILLHIADSQGAKKVATEAPKDVYKPVSERTTEIPTTHVEIPDLKVKNQIPKELESLADEARKYKTVEEFKSGITPKQFREFLNATGQDNAMTASARATGARVRKEGDYLFHQDREYFDAQLDDIQNGRNVNSSGFHTDLTDFYNKATNATEVRPPIRPNLKLEKMAEESPTYEAFAKRAGVGQDTLEATAKKKGFDTAEEFYQTAKAAGGDEARVLQTGAKKRGLPELPKLSDTAREILNPEGLTKERAAIGELKTGRDILKDAADTMPGKDLQKFESRATGELPEVTGKTSKESLTGSGELIRGGRFTKEGDQIMSDLGFETAEEAQKALDDYKSLRKQIKAADQSVRDKVKAYRDRKAVFDEVVRFVNAQGQARRERITAVEDFFKFNEKDMQALLKGERDVRLMSDQDFESFMKKLEGRATERYLRSQAINELQDTILNKELKKVDNIRRVLKLPRIENMSMGQLRDFNDFMQQFKVGDEFLSVRKLETVERTDLNGIYTLREAQERLLSQVNKEREAAGKPLLSLEDLSAIKTTELDRYRGDTTLARQNPFFDLMVQEKNRAFLTAEMNSFEAKERINELFAAARKSRSRGLTDRLIPTDGFIFKWLEATDADKLKLAEDMTPEELDAAMYVRSWYSEARDYLLQQKVLKKFRTDYVTHTLRGFLEAWKEEAGYVQGMVDNAKDGPAKRFAKGLLAAFKESFAKYVQDEAYFNILDQATDQVLPLEKFFQYSMARTGELVPSKNVAKAFLQYLSTFEKKKALDSIVPKLDIYVQSLTPKKLTPRGLEFDSSLKKFFKEWMNTKKGRVTSNALVKPGGKIDWAMRTGVAFTRLLDLGLSVPVGLASNFGAQIAAYRGLGEKAYATGLGRLLTKQGRDIVHKYSAFAGEPVLAKIRDASGTLGDNIMAGVFGLFSFADRKARQVYLLGKMTPEEFKEGALSADRLARLHNELGRHMPLESNSSILGKTAIGKLGTQYKSWALPLLSSTGDDLHKAYLAAKAGDSAYLKSPEFAELMRTALVSTVVGLGAYGVLSDKTPAKEQSFAEKVAHKAAQDALSLVGALDPTLWTQTPRLVQFLGDLSTAIKQIVLVEQNKDGELSSVNKLEQTLTPSLVRQALPADTKSGSTKTKESASLPKLPQLPKLPKLPKLPRI